MKKTEQPGLRETFEAVLAECKVPEGWYFFEIAGQRVFYFYPYGYGSYLLRNTEDPREVDTYGYSYYEGITPSAVQAKMDAVARGPVKRISKDGGEFDAPTDFR